MPARELIRAAGVKAAPSRGPLGPARELATRPWAPQVEPPALRTDARIARRVQRAPAGSAEMSPGADADMAAAGEGAPAAAGLVVDDDVSELAPGQARKSALLESIRADACAAVDGELARAGRDTEGCPHVERWLAHYRGRPAAHMERAIRKFVSGADSVESATDYVPLVTARLAAGARTWVDTGRLPDDIPAELQAEVMGGGLAGALGAGIASVAGAVTGAVSSVASALGGAARAIGGLFFKRDAGGPAHAVDGTALMGQLGGGRPLESGTRARMESAFGHDFAAVRVHDDSRAGALSRELGAHAFTLGAHVAFADGGYRPGTPVGDALLAHELAHVVQQGGASPARALPLAESQPGDPIEDDADVAAAGVMASLYLPGAGAGLQRRAKGPRLRGGGARFSRCGGSPSRTTLPTGREHEARPRSSLEECRGSDIRIDLRTPPTFPNVFERPLLAMMDQGGATISVPPETTEVRQHEEVPSTLSWTCPGGSSGTESAQHPMDWVKSGSDLFQPDPGGRKTVSDGHIYGPCCGAGPGVMAAARARGFDMNTCDFIFVDNALFETSARAGGRLIHRCQWRFRFELRVEGGGRARGRTSAQVVYTGVDSQQTTSSGP
jgi:hypothetical protein